MNIPILILAAGQSSRLGSPKQLLSVGNTTLLRKTVDICIDSGLGDVYVVVGAYENEVRSVISDSGCTVIVNDEWQKGIGASIARGVSQIEKEQVDGVCIVLADQVFFSVEILEKVYRKASANQHKIVLSKYAEASGPPTFFRRGLFSELKLLNDDTGAKKIVQKYRNSTGTVNFVDGNIDIDTASDLKWLEKKTMKKKKKVDERIVQTRYNDTVSKDLPLCVIFDLDGTISLMNNRHTFDGGACGTDVVNQDVVDLLLSAWESGVTVVLFTGRNTDKGGEEATIEWLKRHKIPYHLLAMRTAKDYRKDTVIKEEFFQKHIQGKYRVWYVAEDRNMMVDHWRDKGITCLQVYYGDF